MQKLFRSVAVRQSFYRMWILAFLWSTV